MQDEMTTPYQTPDYDDKTPDYGPAPIKTEYKFSHVTTGRYLPTPGKAPGWPFADIGQWMIDANASSADWLAELKDWRREHLVRIGYDDSATQFVMMCHAQAMNLFYILGCSNVDTADNPAPAALNKKRARTGKFPILTHKTLVIVADAKRHEKANCGGTHTSPRVHLRRGHIRRVGESRRVWVQPCVVGSKHGVVTKDYKVVMG